MYFITEDEILQFVAKQSYENLKAQNPLIFQSSYELAVSTIESEIGYIYDLQTMLSMRGSERDSVLLRMMKVLTAWNICGSSLNISQPLITNYNDVQSLIMNFKGGSSRMVDAPLKGEKNSHYVIVDHGKKYLG